MIATCKLLVICMAILAILNPYKAEGSEIIECVSKLTDLPYGIDGRTDELVNTSEGVTYYVEVPGHRKVSQLPNALSQLAGIHGWEKPIRLVIFGDIDISELSVALERAVELMDKTHNHMVTSWSNVSVIYVGTENVSSELLSAVGKANITFKRIDVDILSLEARKSEGC